MRYVIENEPVGTSTRTYKRECWKLVHYFKDWEGTERSNILGWSYIEENVYKLVQLNGVTL